MSLRNLETSILPVWRDECVDVDPGPRPAGLAGHRASLPSVAIAASARASSGWPQLSRRQLPKLPLGENIGPGAMLMPWAGAWLVFGTCWTAIGLVILVARSLWFDERRRLS